MHCGLCGPGVECKGHPLLTSLLQSGAGSKPPMWRATKNIDRVLVEDIELQGRSLRFVRVFDWEQDPTAYTEHPQERLEFFNGVHGWTPVDTLEMAEGSRIRTAVRRWCDEHPENLRD